MAAITLHGQSHSKALELAQKAPQYLEQQTTGQILESIPFVSSTESPDLWMTYEKLVLSCLLTGDEKSAHLCLERLIKRFGASNERVMGLRGLYQEAVATNSAELGAVLHEYESLLQEDPTNTPIMKRRIALLQSLDKIPEAIGALVELLDISPTDAEAWAELSDLYLSQALYSQACFCLEEVLLICPNAWNIHARLGEVLFMSSFSPGNGNNTSIERALSEGVRRYCRSIELCDGYLRGFYGLKMSTDRLLETVYRDNKPEVRNSTDTDIPRQLPLEVVRELNRKATAALDNIVRRSTAGDVNYSGFDESEIISAKALLDQHSSNP